MDIRGAIWLPEHMARGSMTRLPRSPSGTPSNYKTYALLRPRGSHFEPATCEQYECHQYINGFDLFVDTSKEIGQKQFHYVTHDKTRTCRMERTGQYTFVFHYPPGNDGFGEGHRHFLPLHRPPTALVMPGDWRGQTGEATHHKRLEDWVDDSQNHHDKLATAKQRG
jgi:hypothetical protein